MTYPRGAAQSLRRGGRPVFRLAAGSTYSVPSLSRLSGVFAGRGKAAMRWAKESSDAGSLDLSPSRRHWLAVGQLCLVPDGAMCRAQTHQFPPTASPWRFVDPFRSSQGPRAAAGKVTFGPHSLCQGFAQKQQNLPSLGWNHVLQPGYGVWRGLQLLLYSLPSRLPAVTRARGKRLPFSSVGAIPSHVTVRLKRGRDQGRLRLRLSAAMTPLIVARVQMGPSGFWRWETFREGPWIPGSDGRPTVSCKVSTSCGLRVDLVGLRVRARNLCKDSRTHRRE
jgi:hypothetical protein